MTTETVYLSVLPRGRLGVPRPSLVPLDVCGSDASAEEAARAVRTTPGALEAVSAWATLVLPSGEVVGFRAGGVLVESGVRAFRLGSSYGVMDIGGATLRTPLLRKPIPWPGYRSVASDSEVRSAAAEASRGATVGAKLFLPDGTELPADGAD